MHYFDKTDNKSVHYGLYITAAAFAGLACCTAVPVKALAKTPDLWDESQILENWGIAPDSVFGEGSEPYDSGETEAENAEAMTEKEENLSRVPEDLQPYFKESAAAAVNSYSGFIPPSYDSEKYSPRADAVRRAVIHKAQEETSRYTDALINELVTAVRTTLEGRRALNDKPEFASVFSSRPVTENMSEFDKIREKLLIWPVQEYYLKMHGSEDDQDGSGDSGTNGGQDSSEGADQAKDQDLNGEDRADAGAEEPEQVSEQESWAVEESDHTQSRPFLPLRDPYGRGSARTDSSAVGGDENEESRRTIFIGDSRTVGMYMYAPVNLNEYWSARDSMGYEWMVNAGIPRAEDLIRENTDVVILMGVNDLGNVKKYTSYINKKAAEWKEKGARTFFVSVTPVVDSKSPNAKNSRIESFNAYIRENLQGVHYIDAYNRIRSSFGSKDGIHFDGPTYREIYNIIHFYLYKGWYEEAGLRFYFDCGRPLTGWNYIDGKWHYMDGSGVCWITDSRVGDVCFEPYPGTGLLTPCRAVSLEY